MAGPTIGGKCPVVKGGVVAVKPAVSKLRDDSFTTNILVGFKIFSRELKKVAKPKWTREGVDGA